MFTSTPAGRNVHLLIAALLLFIFLRPPESVESLSDILKEIEAVPTYLPNCLLLRDFINRATEWLKEAEALQVKHAEDHVNCINAGFLLMFYPK